MSASFDCHHKSHLLSGHAFYRWPRNSVLRQLNSVINSGIWIYRFLKQFFKGTEQSILTIFCNLSYITSCVKPIVFLLKFDSFLTWGVNNVHRYSHCIDYILNEINILCVKMNNAEIIKALPSTYSNMPTMDIDERLRSKYMDFLQSLSIAELNKNQNWDPLRAMKTFIRRKVGHTT